MAAQWDAQNGSTASTSSLTLDGTTLGLATADHVAYMCPFPGCNTMIMNWGMAQEHSILHAQQQTQQGGQSQQQIPTPAASMTATAAAAAAAAAAAIASAAADPVSQTFLPLNTALQAGPGMIVPPPSWPLNDDEAGSSKRKRNKASDGSIFACPVCGIKVSRIDSLTRHTKRKHPEYAENGTAIDPVFDSLGSSSATVAAAATGGASASSNFNLSTSASKKVPKPAAKANGSETSSTHSTPQPQKKFECAICGTVLSRIDSLARHMRKQHGQAPPP
ncbi:hypothetical protein K437DRAFT_266187 [Tilletiaria anomala UBC 951]|uniref:C2H2-type domain-containing protein n=1 Tax=Tilletiaria anomala (strain ATCC 24038 / CBS 436.72 / UBC 951) TaxID=1037660 RepID=A0A066WPR8_TILAU|nr:uncharacterized protein K437DRAFT_266187 [Tilletiaria anomala UBC 951]KDN52989.1 hypothetical protein K437DRAFT_266187 [Tilletiaria anomala UBC 951]